MSLGTSENVIRYVRTLAGTSEWYQTAQSFIKYLRTSFLNQDYQTLKTSLHTKETSQIPSYFRAYKTVQFDLCKASSVYLNKTTQRKVTQNTYQFSKSRWRWSGQELNHLHGFKAGEKVGQHSGGDETDEALGLEACINVSLIKSASLETGKVKFKLSAVVVSDKCSPRCL